MARIYKRGKSWYLETGRDKRVSLGRVTEAEARESLRLKEAELKRQRLANIVELPKGRITFDEIAKEYLRWHKPRTSKTSHSRIRGMFTGLFKTHFGSTPLVKMSRAQGERYVSQRQALDSPPKTATINKEIKQLKAFMNWCLKMDYVSKSPFDALETLPETDSKPPRWYTTEELGRLYVNSKCLRGDEVRCKDGRRPVNSHVKDYGGIFRLLANTGLRRSEALNLRWDDVADDSLRVLSTDRARTKSGKWRQVPLSKAARASLDDLGREFGAEGRVLPRVSATSLSRAFRRSADRAGLDGNLHCLRHTFAAHLVMSGVDIYTVQKILGHSSVLVTQRYAHLAPGYLQDAVKGIDL